MCVGISLALSFLMAYYTYATLEDYSLVETLDNQTVVIAQGTQMLEVMWPLVVLGVILGVLGMLIWMKFKKIM
jgi:hypothetical protein